MAPNADALYLHMFQQAFLIVGMPALFASGFADRVP